MSLRGIILLVCLGVISIRCVCGERSPRWLHYTACILCGSALVNAVHLALA